MTDCIGLMESAFKQLSSGAATVPLRVPIDHPEYDGTSLFMPVYQPEKQQIAVKVVTLFKNNTKLQLPLIHGVMLVFDGTNGKPIALLDAESITALRTGAASGLATHYLARKHCKTIAIIGAGIQSETQLEAVSLVRSLQKVNVYDPNREQVVRFIDQMSKQFDYRFEACSLKDCLADADIICTATTSPTPVFSAKMAQAGTHINAIGSYKPEKSEIPIELVGKSKIIVDSREAALLEAGEIIQAIQGGFITKSDIYAELGEIVSGQKPARENDQEITLFKSVGNAVQDSETAAFLMDKAEQQNVGTLLEL